jgi:dTDP-4-amino-4,6-dideoxygalactose transaminase
MIWRCDLVPQYLAHKREIDKCIRRVLLSGRYILAGELERFEKTFAGYLGVKHSIGVANGTDGLILALKALDIGVGDEVITTPFTAIPTVSAIIDSGATPVFVDICPDTFLLDIDKIPKALTAKTKAVIPVHIFGNVVDIPRLRRILGPGIRIIEDASQSHGSTWRGIQSGSMGDMGVFSFYPTKNLGGYGDGGMIVTNNIGLAKKSRLLRMYGMIDKDHITINGINSRLDEIQAAILNVKLKHLDDMNRTRNCIIDEFKKNFHDGIFEYQRIPSAVFSNFHIFAVRVRHGLRNQLITDLARKEIQTNIYYPLPLHLQKANKYLGLKKGQFPVAEKLCREVMALPLYPEMIRRDQNRIVEVINGFVDRAI